MTSQIITSISGVLVSEASPTTAFGLRGYIALRQGSGNDMHSLLKWGLPGPRNAVYSNCKLRIYNTGAAIGSRTYKAKRLAQPYSTTYVKWANKPFASVVGEVSVTQSVGAKGTANDYVEFDITGILNHVSSGAVPWYGIEISMTTADGTTRGFYTWKGSSTKGPTLDATWSTAPKTPIDLNPSDGSAVAVEKPVFTGTFVDISGSTVMTNLQIQIHSTDDFSGAVDFDSGSVAASTPYYDGASGAWTGIGVNATKWWRMRTQDADGNWSPYSSPISFSRIAKGVASLDAPTDSPNDFVEEVTPTVLFSLSAATQQAAQLLIYNDAKTAIVYNSNKLTTTDTSFTVTTPLQNGVWYRAQIRIWDDVVRSTVPEGSSYSADDGATYSVDEVRFLVTLSAVPAPTTDLSVAQVGKLPQVEGTFERATPPDFFDIFRNNDLIMGNVDPADLFVSGTTYEFTDRNAPPRIPVEYEVRPKVNGQTASGNATDTITVKPITAYLSALDGEFAIPLLKYSDDLTYQDGSTVIDVLNSPEAITVYGGSSGFRGEFAGILSGTLPGILGTETARDHLNNLKKLRLPENQGRLMVLSFKDQSIVCTVSKVQYSATVYLEEITYLAEFFVTEKVGALQ